MTGQTSGTAPSMHTSVTQAAIAVCHGKRRPKHNIRSEGSHLYKSIHVQKHSRLSSSLCAHQLPVDPDLKNLFLARRAHLRRKRFRSSRVSLTETLCPRHVGACCAHDASDVLQPPFAVQQKGSVTHQNEVSEDQISSSTREKFRRCRFSPGSRNRHDIAKRCVSAR